MSHTTFEGPKVYPVIHNEHTDEVLREVEEVIYAGADGVFLINHHDSANSLLERYIKVAESFPDDFIGLNFLDLANATEVYEYLNSGCITPSAVWTDWYSPRYRDMQLIDYMTPVNTTSGQRTMLFAGVSHKAASYSANPRVSAGMASTADPFVDFVTTTGPGTGVATPVDKLVAMRAKLSHAKLAVASGVTPENVGDYVPLVDAILVASSIESRFGEIDPERLQSFMSALNQAVSAEQEARALTS